MTEANSDLMDSAVTDLITSAAELVGKASVDAVEEEPVRADRLEKPSLSGSEGDAAEDNQSEEEININDGAEEDDEEDEPADADLQMGLKQFLGGLTSPLPPGFGSLTFPQS